MDSFANAIIGSAATDVSGHGLGNLIVGWVGSFSQERGSSHDLADLAIAALRHLFGDPRLLEGGKPVAGKAFDGSDALAAGLRDRHGAGTGGVAFNVDGTGATEPGAASELGSGHLQRIAQNPEQRRGGRDIDLVITAVNFESEL